MITFLRLISKLLWASSLMAIAAAVGMIILNGGTWPSSLSTVQNLFQTLHEYFGPLAYLIQIALFAGPGFLASWMADTLDERTRRNSN